jgi:hypothetical protein
MQGHGIARTTLRVRRNAAVRLPRGCRPSLAIYFLDFSGSSATKALP